MWVITAPTSGFYWEMECRAFKRMSVGCHRLERQALKSVSQKGHWIGACG